MNKGSLLYGWMCIMAGIFVTGCFDNGKRLNKRVTLWRNDKIPYGAWYAYDQLSTLYPYAYIENRKLSPDPAKNRTAPENEKGSGAFWDDSTNTLYMVVSPSINPDAGEMEALFSMINKGNHVFLSAFSFGEVLSKNLKFETSGWESVQADADSLGVSIFSQYSGDTQYYSYPGNGYHSWFTHFDSVHTRVIGWDELGHATFIQFADTSGGTLLLHSTPLALTNFFLLHKQNKSYYDQVFSSLPGNIEYLVWDDYFRNRDRKNAFSSLQVILKNKSLRTSFFVVLLLLGLLLFSEVKRRQRMVPVLLPQENSSLDFVKTIGRLYFQRKNNADISAKMAVHFKDHIRSKFALDTSYMDDSFALALAKKSGYTLQDIKDLLNAVKMAEVTTEPDDESLLAFHRQLNKFYKNQ